MDVVGISPKYIILAMTGSDIWFFTEVLLKMLCLKIPMPKQDKGKKAAPSQIINYNILQAGVPRFVKGISP